MVWKDSLSGFQCQHKICLLRSTYLSKRFVVKYLRDQRSCPSSGACCRQPSSLQPTGLQSETIKPIRLTFDWVWRSFNSLIIRPLSIIITLQEILDGINRNGRENLGLIRCGCIRSSFCFSVKFELGISIPGVANSPISDPILSYPFH